MQYGVTTEKGGSTFAPASVDNHVVQGLWVGAVCDHTKLHHVLLFRVGHSERLQKQRKEKRQKRREEVEAPTLLCKPEKPPYSNEAFCSERKKAMEVLWVHAEREQIPPMPGTYIAGVRGVRRRHSVPRRSEVEPLVGLHGRRRILSRSRSTKRCHSSSPTRRRVDPNFAWGGTKKSPRSRKWVKPTAECPTRRIPGGSPSRKLRGCLGLGVGVPGDFSLGEDLSGAICGEGGPRDQHGACAPLGWPVVRHHVRGACSAAGAWA